MASVLVPHRHVHDWKKTLHESVPGDCRATVTMQGAYIEWLTDP